MSNSIGAGQPLDGKKYSSPERLSLYHKRAVNPVDDVPVPGPFNHKYVLDFPLTSDSCGIMTDYKYTDC